MLLERVDSIQHASKQETRNKEKRAHFLLKKRRMTDYWMMFSNIRSMMESLPDHVLMQCLGRLSASDQAIARCVCCRFRNVLSIRSTLEHRAREGHLEPWLCVLGGVQEEKEALVAEMFDFRAEKWRPMPVPPPKSFFNFACAVIDFKLYVVGGFVGLSAVSSKMCMYDMRTNRWENKEQMLEVREAFACGVIRGHIYVSGGLARSTKREQQRVRTAEVYIPKEDKWFPIASMSEGRSCCTSAVVADKLYVFGGYGSDGILKSVEVYNPMEGTWARKADMPGVWIIAGCAAIGSNIYIVGSDINNMDQSDLIVYDTLLDQWHLNGSVPFKKLITGTKCSLWGCALAAVDGKLYLLGGASSYDGGGLNSVLVYDPESLSASAWMTLQQMQNRRHGCAAALINL